MKIAIIEDPIFWYSSLWITLSVTQFAYLTAMGKAAVVVSSLFSWVMLELPTMY